ncbi:MAG TPA: 30S ribosomal protein S6 [Roseiflexaceae bacterium]|jgi:small subunit ribosomal protein S6|nr:30S ribosomal protein S6 [Roseiflexaceae bacterium]
MRERRREYELMFIVSPLASAEEDINANIDRVQQAITSLGGEVTNVEHSAPWGRRKLAYPIRKYAEGEASRRSFTEGHYVLCYFSLATSQLPEVERALKLNDAILRYMLLLVEHKDQRVAAGAAASDEVTVLDTEDEDVVEADGTDDEEDADEE